MWHHNVELLAYHDLNGRSGFKLALQEVSGHFFLYIAGFWHSGWSILEVTDPENPELLRFVEGPPNTMTLQVQVADRTKITGLEHPFPGLPLSGSAEPQDGFLIWDVKEPDRPQLLGRWVSGETGTHRHFFNGGRWVYATSTLPGFEGHILAIVDIEDPTYPKVTGSGGTQDRTGRRRVVHGGGGASSHQRSPLPRRVRPWPPWRCLRGRRSCLLPVEARRDGHP